MRGVDETRGGGTGLDSTVFKAMREGLEGTFSPSSFSSDARLRLDEALRVGSIFSESMSSKGFLLPVMAAPGDKTR